MMATQSLALLAAIDALRAQDEEKYLISLLEGFNSDIRNAIEDFRENAASVGFERFRDALSDYFRCRATAFEQAAGCPSRYPPVPSKLSFDDIRGLLAEHNLSCDTSAEESILMDVQDAYDAIRDLLNAASYDYGGHYVQDTVKLALEREAKCKNTQCARKILKHCVSSVDEEPVTKRRRIQDYAETRNALLKMFLLRD
jgi:hypothetical protein